MTERVVVVGLGAVTCLGRDMDATWDGLVAGRSGLKRRDALDPGRFLRDVGGMVEGFGPGTPDEEPSVAKLEAKFIHLAMAASRMAWADAGLDRMGPGDSSYDPHRVAVSIGSAFGGVDLLDAEIGRAARRKSLQVSPYLVPGLIINQASGQVAQHLGLFGPSISPANACAAGGDAIALGAMFLRSGEADFALCGGAESAFMPAILNGFATMKALAARRPEDRSFDDPAQASRPFSVDRAGFVMAEGSAMLALATESAARRLGLKVRAELLGWGTNSDGHHLTTPHQDRIARLLRRTLDAARVRPAEVDYYNAHGTSTPVNDKVETAVVKEVFGEHASRLPVSSIKGALGHALGASAAIEAAACVRALETGLIPPTINHRPDPELDLDYVAESRARPADLRVVLSASFGFGGTNNALIFKRGDHD
jgi:3-oxoacyl-[acyl-carrier-protein] synthase II